MKTLTLTLLLFSLALTTEAQWSLTVQGGIQKPAGYTRVPQVSTSSNYDNVIPYTGLAIGAYAINEKQRTINLGVGVSLETNHITRYSRRTDESYNSPLKGVSELQLVHKSTYLSIHPVLDVNLDDNRYFHLLLNPSIGFFVAGGDNGYRSYNSAIHYLWEDFNQSTDRIKKLVLGLSAQVQFQYPVTDWLKPMLALGYSVSNSPADFIPTETGAFSCQAGLRFFFRAQKEANPETTTN